MTEIPEHLLKRSKERRAAIGGEEAPASEALRRRRPRRSGRGGPCGAGARGGAAVAATPEPGPGPRADAARGGGGRGPQEDPVLGHAGAGRPPAVGLRVPGHPRARPHRRAHPGGGGRRDLQAAACAGCHGAGGGGSASVPALTERPRDVARLPRPHDVGAARAPTGWLEFADTYGAQRQARCEGGMPAHPGLDRPGAGARSCSTSGSQFGELEEGTEEYQLLLEIAEGETDLRRRGPRRDLRRRRRSPRRTSPPGLTASIARLAPESRPADCTRVNARRIATTSSSSAAGRRAPPPGTGSAGPGATWSSSRRRPSRARRPAATG